MFDEDIDGLGELAWAGEYCETRGYSPGEGAAAG